MSSLSAVIAVDVNAPDVVKNTQRLTKYVFCTDVAQHTVLGLNVAN